MLAVLMVTLPLFEKKAATACADTTNDDQEVTDFDFGRVVTFGDAPVAGVEMTISGNGFEATTTPA